MKNIYIEVKFEVDRLFQPLKIMFITLLFIISFIILIPTGLNFFKDQSIHNPDALTKYHLLPTSQLISLFFITFFNKDIKAFRYRKFFLNGYSIFQVIKRFGLVVLLNSLLWPFLLYFFANVTINIILNKSLFEDFNFLLLVKYFVSTLYWIISFTLIYSLTWNLGFAVLLFCILNILEGSILIAYPTASKYVPFKSISNFVIDNEYHFIIFLAIFLFIFLMKFKNEQVLLKV